eukprot:PITA_18712
MGYTDAPHNYQVYLPTSRRTVVHRDLKFVEQKAMQVSLERELQLQVPVVETSTQANSSKDGWTHTREADGLLEDAIENVGAPLSQQRQRRSPERYTRYMALAQECVETEPSSFEEAMQQPIWVDAMVEEYNSIVHNSFWDVVSRPKNKSVVSSHWLYKVTQAIDCSVEKHKARFVSCGFS